MSFTVDIDFASLVQYAVQEIRKIEAATPPDDVIASLDMSIERSLTDGCFRAAALLLMVRVGITNFTDDEANHVFDAFLRTRCIASMIRDWAEARDIPIHPDHPDGEGDDAIAGRVAPDGRV